MLDLAPKSDATFSYYKFSTAELKLLGSFYVTFWI